jgi:formiminotetrahydrofolate cyclodeaminase
MADEGSDRPGERATPEQVLARILDASDASVGGGSAAALSAAMAAGLLGMVARLSVARGLPLSDDRYQAVATEADELRDGLIEGAAEDAAVYALVKGAYGLPRDTDEHRAARKTAIDEALIAAATVPRDNARRAARVLKLCRELAGKSNESAASDLAVGEDLARVGVLGCAGNIDVNVSSVEGSRAADLLGEADELRRLC